MSEEEIMRWVAYLWTFSLGTAVWMTLGFATGHWNSPLIIFAILFAVAFPAWLFRITYLAGTKR